MPHFKTEKITEWGGEFGVQTIKIKINISARDGHFYCYVDEKYLLAARSVFGEVHVKDYKIKVDTKTYEKLKIDLKSMLKIFAKPETSEEHVIRYNIESHVSFCEDESGNIYPNGSMMQAATGDYRWNDRDKYGDHTSNKPSCGGYCLTIGARAMTKTTLRFGTEEKTRYSNYYKDGGHLGSDNPAELLNSWCSFRLDDDAKEMPYSDKAALFFHNLLLGMAKLSKMIQDSMFDHSDLLNLIESQKNILMIENKEQL